MKRLALSLLGGCALPFLYEIVLSILLLWTKNRDLIVRLYYPLKWPILILFRLFPLGSFPLRPIDRAFLDLLVVICNGLLCSIPIYFLLWRFSRRKKPVQTLPPDPPTFVQQ